MEEKIKIEFKGTVYNIDKSELVYFISRLENSKDKEYSEAELLKLMEKYDLYYEDFLQGVSRA